MVVFGDTMQAGRMDGYMAVPGGWEPVSGIAVGAIHDRFPSQMRAAHYQQLLAERNHLPMGNPEAFTLLCRDKLRCQAALVGLGVPMPPVEADPSRFADRLETWGTGFLKPRYGALGVGVRVAQPGEPLPRTCPGLVTGREEPAILQQAISPPAGWAGQAIRVLVQRTSQGWHIETPVVRSSRTDPVANAARGAEVAAGPAILKVPVLERIHRTAQQVTAAFDRMRDADTVVEAGLDMVMDPEGMPHLIEVNSRPRGRLEVLADHDPSRYRTAHTEACARPIRMLAQWAAG